MSKFTKEQLEKLDRLDIPFPGTKDKVLAGKCGSPGCENVVSLEDFDDILSAKEFAISFMCKKCQDSIFKN